VPAQLADEMGIHGGEKVKVISARGVYIAKAMVTKRIKAMMIDGASTVVFGLLSGVPVVAPQRPVRGQGGFIQVAFRCRESSTQIRKDRRELYRCS